MEESDFVDIEEESLLLPSQFHSNEESHEVELKKS